MDHQSELHLMLNFHWVAKASAVIQAFLTSLDLPVS